jgi:methyl-accepting chemotaxis protein
MKSIRTKLMMYFFIVLLLVCSTLGVICYRDAANSLVDNAKQNLPQVAVQAAKIVESRLDAQLNVMETIAGSPSITDSNIPLENKLSILRGAVKENGYLLMDIADKNGIAKATNGKTYDVSDREYFHKALAGERAISDPIVNKDNGEIIVVLAVPIKVNNQIVGVLVADTDGNHLSEITNDITFGQTGQASMLSKDGTTIADCDQNLVLEKANIIKIAEEDPTFQSLAELHKRMIAGENGVGKYTYDGVHKYMGFAPITTTGWSIAVYMPEDEVLVGLNQLQISMLIATVLILMIGMVIVYIIGKGISNPILQATNYTAVLANGDFSQEVPEVFLRRKDEFGKFAHASREIQQNTSQMISKIL